MDEFIAKMNVGLIVLTALIAVFAVFALGSPDPVSVRIWPSGTLQIPTFWLIAVGFAAGALATVVLYWIARRNPETSWAYIAVFCAAVMAAASVRAEQASLLQAVLVIILGSAAVIAAAGAFARFQKGERIELQSNWGGLGGGLGGWHLSSVASLMLLALIFAGGATVGGHLGSGSKGDKPEAKGTTQASQPGTTAPTSPAIPTQPPTKQSDKK